MDLNTFLEHMKQRRPVPVPSEWQDFMTKTSQEARRITTELNASCHSPETICELMSRLTGVPVDPTCRRFPPFYTDFGKNIRFGKNVFVNSGCCFQDQGGITIGDGTLIGHQVVLATLNHALEPQQRATTLPGPIVIGKKVWIGAHATILQNVTIGDNAVIAAGAVVTRDVPANTVVAGVPAKVVKTL